MKFTCADLRRPSCLYANCASRGCNGRKYGLTTGRSMAKGPKHWKIGPKSAVSSNHIASSLGTTYSSTMSTYASTYTGSRCDSSTSSGYDSYKSKAESSRDLLSGYDSYKSKAEGSRDLLSDSTESDLNTSTESSSFVSDSDQSDGSTSTEEGSSFLSDPESYSNALTDASSTYDSYTSTDGRDTFSSSNGEYDSDGSTTESVDSLSSGGQSIESESSESSLSRNNSSYSTLSSFYTGDFYSDKSEQRSLASERYSPGRKRKTSLTGGYATTVGGSYRPSSTGGRYDSSRSSKILNGLRAEREGIIAIE